jgi:poly(A)-specific ribonuclease
MQMIVDFPDDFLPLVIPTKGGTTQAVRIVLANSREDKELLEVTRVFFSLLVPHLVLLWI